MINLLDPKLDYIFKNIFGVEENKPVLISFLNALLKGNPHIKDLHLDNTDIAKILEKDKASRLDIKATSDNDTKLDIEIQVRNTGDIPQRAVHYLANMMPKAVETGESYKVAHVIGIWILGKNVTDRQNAISEAYMTFQPSDPDPYQIMADSARIFFIELPKFNPQNADNRDLLTGWLSFLKNPIFMDESFLKIKEVKTAMDTLKYISADDEMRAIADLRLRTISDRNSERTIAEENAMARGLKKGMKRGLKEGIEKGRKEGKEEGIAEIKKKTALNAISMGLSIKQIEKLTNLSAKEIELLQNNKINRRKP